jgi:hypothetical protein
MGKWKLALSTSRVRLLDWPPPRFCEVGDEWCQCRRRKAVASRVAGDVARDAARGRRTAGNHFPRGSRFFRGVPEKADRMEPPRTRGNDLWRARFEALERVDRRTRTRGRRGRRSFARRGPRGIRTAAHRTLGIFSNSCAGVRTESISPNGFVPVIQAQLTGARARDRVGTSAERPRVRPRLTLEAADREARVLTRA